MSTATQEITVDTVESVEVSTHELIERCISSFGSLSQVEATIKGLDDIRKQAGAAYRGWALVALAAKSSGMNGAQWAEETGTNKQSFMRLHRAGLMFGSANAGKVDVDPLAVRSAANVVGTKAGLPTDKWVKACAAVASGKDFGKATRVPKIAPAPAAKVVTDPAGDETPEETPEATPRKRTVDVETAPSVLIEQITARVASGGYGKGARTELAKAVSVLVAELAKAGTKVA